ncbi:putative disease resistance RPP13-like protein 1 [Oryza brachyantha]|uniref:putative disease resistance RPP13-like protein 1 n=1 Tax=Oryza brachyantha TaxID=4533 RepID=UPI001ADC2C1F|nr:putative disease resistance RPP13-like protein 1 [Oryza brachyantha]
MELSKLVGGLGAIAGINEIASFYQLVKSTITSRWSSDRKKQLQGMALDLESGLRRLKDITLPDMYNLIARAEWKIHQEDVAKLLRQLQDAEDLLDKFRWYELKVAIEGNANQSAHVEFLDHEIPQDSSKVKDIQEKLDNISGQMERMGLREATQRFDESVRPETSSFPTETTLFGREGVYEQEDGQFWKKFCAPLTNPLEGSMMLVTTRSPKVACAVKTMEPITLEGLNKNDLWKFFKHCTFGSESSNNYPELEDIGRQIVLKLKGSPLAAKTLGRLLRTSLKTTHWNDILQSELWQLEQNNTDILPALRLSYLYLPSHLKRCFSFCGVYPKDHKFDKNNLAKIWIAQGFVEPEGTESILDGYQYFEDLVNRSFFQKVDGKFVIHDLLHDMAQLVSKHDCFILKDVSDFERVPQSVRHLSILSSTDFDLTNLLSICKHKQLRTLLCFRSLRKKTLASVMDQWCNDLEHMRVFFCAYTKEIPKSIGKSKHLRYLEISGACPFKSLPSEFCSLYKLQYFSARKCKLESLPSDFSKLRNLRRFESWGFKCSPKGPQCFNASSGNGKGIRLMKNANQICGHLKINNLGAISTEDAREGELKNKEHLSELTLEWSRLPQEQGEVGTPVEILQALQPPESVKSLILRSYPGESLPYCFEPHDLPNSSSRDFNRRSDSVHESTDLKDISRALAEHDNGWALKRLTLYNCGDFGDNINCCSLTYLRYSNGRNHQSAVAVAVTAAAL